MADLQSPDTLQAAAAPPALEVRDEAGELVGVYPLVQPTTRIGRNERNDVRLPHARVSGSHLHIAWDGVTARITDQRSTNGTERDGLALRPDQAYTWLPGETVCVGPYALRLLTGQSPAPPERRDSPPVSRPPVVGESAALRLELDAVELKLLPRRGATVSLRLQNVGHEAGNWQIAVEGVPPAWIEVPADSVALYPGDVAAAPLYVEAPPAAPPGNYRVTFRAFQPERPDAPDVAVYADWTVEAPAAPLPAAPLGLESAARQAGALPVASRPADPPGDYAPAPQAREPRQAAQRWRNALGRATHPARTNLRSADALEETNEEYAAAPRQDWVQSLKQWRWLAVAALLLSGLLAGRHWMTQPRLQDKAAALRAAKPTRKDGKTKGGKTEVRAEAKSPASSPPEAEDVSDRAALHAPRPNHVYSPPPAQKPAPKREQADTGNSDDIPIPSASDAEPLPDTPGVTRRASRKVQQSMKKVGDKASQIKAGVKKALGLY